MSNNYYVYVYRDADGNPVYFGQGKGSVRPGSHTAATHNAALQSWLRTASGYRIEVLGPLGSKPMADAVETALISACKPATRLALFNNAPGPSRYRFRPYGYLGRCFHAR